MSAKVDALVFDLGGVLIDVDFGRVMAHWADAAKVGKDRLAGQFGPDEAYCAHERGELSHTDYFASLRKSLSLDLSDEQFLSGWNAIFGDPVPGMEPIVRSLADRFPLYVFSNTNQVHRAHWEPRHRRLLALFREVICSCDIGLRKPDPHAFLFVARRVGVAPQRIAFFDDVEENVAGAREAGLRAFRFSSAEQVKKALAELNIDL
jgi:putative hydrolase of the HAD superfamily